MLSTARLTGLTSSAELGINHQPILGSSDYFVIIKASAFKRNHMKNIIVAALFLLLSTNAFACYDESLSDRANFDNCLVEAEQGDVFAQFDLGLMYNNGIGVVQDYKEAVKWYTKAAEQGYTYAQTNLGFMYGMGQGLVQDYKSAHMWFNIAAANGYSDAVKGRDIVAKRMTASQIEKAQDMAREWMAKHQ